MQNREELSISISLTTAKVCCDFKNPFQALFMANSNVDLKSIQTIKHAITVYGNP